MMRAILGLKLKPDFLLIDGCLELRLWEGTQKTCIKGEDKFPSIAAASVIAKVARDEYIIKLASKYPQYGLETNVGYGTASHREALIKLGPTKLHRASFLSKPL